MSVILIPELYVWCSGVVWLV